MWAQRWRRSNRKSGGGRDAIGCASVEDEDSDRLVRVAGGYGGRSNSDHVGHGELVQKESESKSEVTARHKQQQLHTHTRVKDTHHTTHTHANYNQLPLIIKKYQMSK